MSKEIEDEFYCGTNEEINEFGSARVITKGTTVDEFLTGIIEKEMVKAKEKLDRISDVDFVRIWESTNSLFTVLEELQDRIGCVFSGTAMLRCIHRRARYLRKHGVRITKFTI